MIKYFYSISYFSNSKQLLLGGCVLYCRYCSKFNHVGMTHKSYVNDLFYTNVPNLSNFLL